MKQPIRELAYSEGVSVPVREAMLAMDNQLNSPLLRAAPDLLAALIDLDEAFCSIGYDSTKEERHQYRLALMASRTAIAKATGGQP